MHDIMTYYTTDVLIIVFGHNDLVEEPWMSEKCMAEEMARLGKIALEHSVKRVCFSEVLPRFGDNAFDRHPQFKQCYHLITTHQCEVRLAR